MHCYSCHSCSFLGNLKLHWFYHFLLEKLAFCFFLLAFLNLLPKVWAENKTSSSQNNIIYQADVIQVQLEKGSARLKGNVVIFFEGYRLSANEAEIVLKESRFTARGEVLIENLVTQIYADEVEIFFNDHTGVLKNARIESGQMLVEAKEIRKLDKEVFEAQNSYFSTCTTCPPLWRFGARKIKTNIQKYVDIKSGTLQIGKRPIFWIPWIVFPVNTRRKTGFLPPRPDISFSRGQVGFEQSFFWAIDEHKDLTITPIIYSESGLKTILNYRHVFDSQSRLEFNFGYMKDNHFDFFDFNKEKEVTTIQSRWFLDFKNQFYLPEDFIQKSKFSLLGDLIYLSDFPHEIKGQRESALKNQLSLIRNKSNAYLSHHLSIEFIYHINLLTEDIKSKNFDAVHRTPEIRYSILERPFWNRFRFRLDNEYIRFARKGLSFDEADIINSKKQLSQSPSGSYNPETDLIRTGQRLFLNPHITGSFNLNQKLMFLPRLSFLQSLYSFDPSPSGTAFQEFSKNALRSYVIGELEFKTQFSKVHNSNWKHIIEPSVSYINGNLLHQTDHVFFDSTRGLPFHRRYQPINDADFFDYTHGIQFDYLDRIENTQVLKFSLLQSLLQKKKIDGISTYNQAFYFELSQTYDFLHAQIDQPDPWSNLTILAKAKTKKLETFTQTSYFHKLMKTNISTRNKYIYKPGHFFEITYKNNYLVDDNNQETLRQEFLGFGLGWNLQSLNFSGRFLYSTLEDQIQRWNGHLSYSPPGNCIKISVDGYYTVSQRQINRPDLKFEFQWNFGSGTESNTNIKAIF